jgi:ribose/xylose/arabinose/galactoside ABC-type transport system permease subunit
MTPNMSTFLSRNRRLLPLSATIVLFFLAYAVSALYLPGMRDTQVFLNLFNQTPYLLVSVIGETLVVISGGIDLSVGGIVALTTTASAALLRTGNWNPWVVMLLMLALGTTMGFVMGYFITYLKVQPFIATLAGMWIGRGLSYFISNDSIAIDNRIYALLARIKILIPGLADPVSQTGDYITPSVVIAGLVFAILIYAAHYTRFGRTIYAMGGNNGANEQSALYMGLPVDRTKLLVYTLNGFCSALSGILLSIYTGSGHGAYGNSMELTVIAAVVIGGTALTGGEGYVFGALFGVLITILIQTVIQFQGTLISWWTLIAVGAITLFFIGIQAIFANLKIGGPARARVTRPMQTRRALLIASGIVAVIALSVFTLSSLKPGVASAVTPSSSACQQKPLRQNQATSLLQDGAVIVYERNGGTNCIDEVYGIYPDGRIVGDNGVQKVTKQITAPEVDHLLAFISGLGWFTDNIYSSSHLPCQVCYTYFTSVTYQGKTKTVQAVDGGTDAPSEYWLMTGQFSSLLPKFAP